MQTSRREFMAGAAGVAAGAFFMGQAHGVSANDRIRIGVIGCGSRGNNHIDECLKYADKYNVELVALADVWKVNREKTAAKIKEKSGHEPKTFARYGDLLALPDVDAVFITTPDFAHCPVLTDAAKAKKHAYCEKPMGCTMEHTKAAVDAVEANKIVCQIGTQRRSEGQHIAAAQLIQSGILGKMIKCEAAWHDCNPRWERPFEQVKREDVDWEQYLMYLPKRDFDPRMYMCWHLYKECTIGLVGLLGSHVIDVTTWYMDDPIPHSAVGLDGRIAWPNRQHSDSQECLFMFPKGFILQYSTFLGNAIKVPENLFCGTKGTFDTASWTARGEGARKEDAIKEPVKVTPVASTGHIENWIQCMRTNNTKTNATVQNGYAHSVISIMGAQACDTGKRQVYDGDKREIHEG